MALACTRLSVSAASLFSPLIVGVWTGVGLSSVRVGFQLLSPAVLPPYPESLSSNAWSRAALSDVEPDPTVMYCGRLDARGASSLFSPEAFPLGLYSWLIVMAGSSVASRAMDLGVAMMVFEEFRDEAINIRRYKVPLARKLQFADASTNLT